MTNIQSALLKVIFGLPPALRNYSGVISNIPKFMDTVDELENIGHDILLLTKRQMVDVSGITSVKRDRRENLVVFTADNSNKISAFAMNTNNVQLSAEVKFTKTGLRAMPDTELLSCADLVLQSGDDYLNELIAYGITEETQAQQKLRRNAFLEIMNAPRTELMKQTQVTSQLAALFDKAESLLKILDTLIEVVHIDQPELYEVYQKTRKMIASGKSFISLRGLVTDAATEKPIVGAVVTIVPIDGTPALEGGQITKTSADKGGFNVKSLPDGIYRLQASKPGYKDCFVEIAVSGSELAIAILRLEKK